MTLRHNSASHLDPFAHDDTNADANPTTETLTIAPDDLPTLDQLADELFRDEAAPVEQQRSASQSTEPRTSRASHEDEDQDALDTATAELIAAHGALHRLEAELQAKLAAAQHGERERLALAEAHARLQSDFDNFRRRSERDRVENEQALVGAVVNRLLPLADNFDRAAQIGEEALNPEGFRQFAVGVDLIGKQLGEVLASYGVVPVAAVGEIFDPHVHEAVAVEQVAGLAPNTIFEEIVRGYRLGDTLLRAALVKVVAGS